VKEMSLPKTRTVLLLGLAAQTASCSVTEILASWPIFKSLPTGESQSSTASSSFARPEISQDLVVCREGRAVSTPSTADHYADMSQTSIVFLLVSRFHCRVAVLPHVGPLVAGTRRSMKM
jgi:hypothetical protein